MPVSPTRLALNIAEAPSQGGGRGGKRKRKRKRRWCGAPRARRAPVVGLSACRAQTPRGASLPTLPAWGNRGGERGNGHISVSGKAISIQFITQVQPDKGPGWAASPSLPASHTTQGVRHSIHVAGPWTCRSDGSQMDSKKGATCLLADSND